jgi:hypothetical protein
MFASLQKRERKKGSEARRKEGRERRRKDRK